MSDWPLAVRIRARLSIWRRKRVQRKFGVLFQEAASLLFRHDPIGVNFEENTDEYDQEVGTILPRLAGCSSALDVRKVVFQEFVKWFDPETAGNETNYSAIAEELWTLWNARRSKS